MTNILVFSQYSDYFVKKDYIFYRGKAFFVELQRFSNKRFKFIFINSP